MRYFTYLIATSEANAYSYWSRKVHPDAADGEHTDFIPFRRWVAYECIVAYAGGEGERRHKFTEGDVNVIFFGTADVDSTDAAEPAGAPTPQQTVHRPTTTSPVDDGEADQDSDDYALERRVSIGANTPPPPDSGSDNCPLEPAAAPPNNRLMCKRKRVAPVVCDGVAHTLMTVPKGCYNKKTAFGVWEKVKEVPGARTRNQFPQNTCSGTRCKTRVRTYCSCDAGSPKTMFCTQCWGNHLRNFSQAGHGYD